MNCDCICIHTAEESCEDDYSIIGADIVAFESSQLGSISGTLVLLENGNNVLCLLYRILLKMKQDMVL